MAHSSADVIVIGKLSGVYGVKGWFKVYSWTDEKKGILDYHPWLIADGDNWQAYELESGKVHGKGIVAKLKGIDDRDEAQALLQRNIGIHKQQRKVLEEGIFYWDELIGLQVVNLQGERFGTIRRMIETGANDVMVVQGDTERLIPYVWKDVVNEVDTDSRVVTVDWMSDYLISE